MGKCWLKQGVSRLPHQLLHSAHNVPTDLPESGASGHQPERSHLQFLVLRGPYVHRMTQKLTVWTSPGSKGARENYGWMPLRRLSGATPWMPLQEDALSSCESQKLGGYITEKNTAGLNFFLYFLLSIVCWSLWESACWTRGTFDLIIHGKYTAEWIKGNIWPRDGASSYHGRRTRWITPQLNKTMERDRGNSHWLPLNEPTF